MAEERKDKIVLVACCGQKRDGIWPAKDLYQSDLFKKSRRWAELNGDIWFILSAKFGLLDPEKVVRLYDETLKDKTPEERVAWNEGVAREMEPFRDQDIIVLAGDAYCGWTTGFNVSRPLKGLRIGQQLAWFNNESKDEEKIIETWKNDFGWTWEVIKKNQKDDDKPFASWFCKVYSPFLPAGEFEYGDTYVKDIKMDGKARKVE